MRNGIKEFQPRQSLGRQLTAKTLNDIIRELESLRITRVFGGTFRKLPGGTEIIVNSSGGGGGSIVQSHPFQLKSFAKPVTNEEEESDSHVVTVLPGTINSLLPDNIFDGIKLTEHEIPNNTLKFVILNATSNGQQITAASVVVESSAPSPQQPEIFGLPASARFLIGAVYNSSVYQVITDNITVSAKQHLIRTKLTPAEPGELPYEIYYVWG